MKAAVLIFQLILIMLTLRVKGQEPPPAEAPRKPFGANIFIEVQMVALPEATALSLIPDLADHSKIEAAYNQVQELLSKGTAKLIGWPILTLTNGERATIENIHEFRYVTEYEPPMVPSQFLIDQKQKDPNPDPHFTPRAFETRNIGVSLEAEATVQDDGKTLEISLAPQHVSFLGMKKIVTETEKSKKVFMEQPEFSTTKVTTRLSFKSGTRKLLGIFKTTDPADHIELFILKAEVQRSK